MATASKEGSPYGGGGGGGGGKFRKRPYRRPQTTPYDRPPTALRNPSATINNNGWLSKIVDPASKLITASAHRFFSSVFRKRLPPPPPPLPPQPQPQPQLLSEAKKDSWDKLHEAVSTNPPATQERTINEGDNPSNNNDSGGITALEQILKQKTFTRSEIDRLTALLHSRTGDIPVRNEEKRSELNLLELVAAHDRQEGLVNSPVQENGIGSDRLLGVTSTPIVSSRVPEEDVASPAELAKAYMGSRPSKVSPSMLGMRSQPFKGDSPLLSNLPLPPKSPIMSLVPKSSVHVGVHENGFMTPRSRGRSAIYSMARTPYSRMHPSAFQKGSGSTIDVHGGPSSSQSALEQNRLSSSKQVALKRRSSVLDNDIGSVGPIRRIRQKPNLLSSKGLGLPVSGSPISITGSGIVSKFRTENVDNSIPGTSFAPVPSQSSEMAKKILQQLDKLVPSPKEKPSEIKLADARDKLPARLTPDMLSGQALRSLENVDSSKFLENVQDNNKLDGSFNTGFPDARETTSQKQYKVQENGPIKIMDLPDRTVHAVNGAHTSRVLNKDTAHTFKTSDSDIMHPVAHSSPQKKQAFHMSAHEDYLDLDDDGYSNGAASTPLVEGRENLDTTLVETKTEAVLLEKPPVFTEVKPIASSLLNTRTDLETSDGSVVVQKSTGFTFPVAPTASTIIQPAVLAAQSTSLFNTAVPPKEPNAFPPIFSFSSKTVDKVPPFTFASSSSVVTESSGLKFGALSDPKPESLSSFDTVAAGATNAVLRAPESDKVDDKNTQKAGDIFRKPENAFSSAVSTSTSTTSIFSFGAPADNPSLNNGSLPSSHSTFSSPTPILSFNNITNQNLYNSSTGTDTSTTTATTTASITATTVPSGNNSNIFTSAAVPSFPAAPIFKFGSSASSTSVSPVSVTSVVESADAPLKNKQETIFGNLTSTHYGGTSSAISSTGSGFFGFSASAASSTANNQSQGSAPFGTGSESIVGAQASPAGTGVANFTQSMPIQFGSSASPPTFGLTATTALASGSSLFGSSTPAAKLLSSGPNFGLSSSASSSEANSISSSSGTSSSLFGSSWQPSTSSIFGTTFNSAPSSTGLSFGASSASVASTNSTPMVFGSSTGASMGSMFSFTSAAANTLSSTSLPSSQPVLGNPNSVFAFGSASSGNNEQMNMEDSMAEDTVQASTPIVPIFGQPSISPPSSGFIFGSTAPSVANPFKFGSQQNLAMPQNSSPFQGSSSLDFNAGGSFSLGTGAGDKSNRKMIKVKQRRAKK